MSRSNNSPPRRISKRVCRRPTPRTSTCCRAGGRHDRARRGRQDGAIARAPHRAAQSAAGPPHRVIAVSRYSSPSRDGDRGRGRDPIGRSARPGQVDALPDSPNVLFLAGRKFGSTDNTSLTWATNTIVPANVARRFSRSRIVAFSTGNVYPFVPVTSGGSVERTRPPRAASMRNRAWAASASSSTTHATRHADADLPPELRRRSPLRRARRHRAQP